jgi:hypothetical protein
VTDDVVWVGLEIAMDGREEARRVAAILYGALEDLLDDLDDTPAEVRDMMGQLAARFPWLKETADD